MIVSWCSCVIWKRLGIIASCTNITVRLCKVSFAVSVSLSRIITSPFLGHAYKPTHTFIFKVWPWCFGWRFWILCIYRRNEISQRSLPMRCFIIRVFSLLTLHRAIFPQPRSLNLTIHTAKCLKHLLPKWSGGNETSVLYVLSLGKFLASLVGCGSVTRVWDLFQCECSENVYSFLIYEWLYEAIFGRGSTLSIQNQFYVVSTEI